MKVQRSIARRDFVKFVGQSAAALSAYSLLQACGSAKKTGPQTPDKSEPSQRAPIAPFEPLSPTMKDEVVLAKGFSSHIIISAGDKLNKRGDTFGVNCDYTAFFPLSPMAKWRGHDGLLWVNHEYTSPLLVSGVRYKVGMVREKSQVMEELKTVGGSIVRIQKDIKTGEWKPVFNDRYNRRITGLTPIPFSNGTEILGKSHAIGMVGNCAGGVTPWGTVLTCEENYTEVYGERIYKDGKPRDIDFTDAKYYGWQTVIDHPPEHYGWVVEIEPKSGRALKHISMGRFGHESATVALARDGRCVVYSGDDRQDRCIYKFIAEKKGSLLTGTLYVADTDKGRWIPLDLKLTPELRKHFQSDLELKIRTREAAIIAGGTQQDRPEDIEIDPVTKSVFVTLTNNKARGNSFGSILKIEEKDANPLSLEFKASTFLAGGEASGFACPDNLCFDRNANLWMTTDISGKSIGKKEYSPFGNNSLFYIPMRGEFAGRAMRVASGPVESELTGPSFSPDSKTLFLSIQHPGEESEDINALTSKWNSAQFGPNGSVLCPRSAVVGLTGEALERLVEVG